MGCQWISATRFTLSMFLESHSQLQSQEINIEINIEIEMLIDFGIIVIFVWLRMFHHGNVNFEGVGNFRFDQIGWLPYILIIAPASSFL